MGDQQAKAALYDCFASVAKALASGRRAEIVDILSQGERSVEEVANAVDQSIANTSHHLRTMARTGLLKSRRDGTHVIYRLAGEHVATLWRSLRAVAVEHVAEAKVLADAYLGDRSTIETITADELDRRLRSGEVVVLDVRPTLEFDAGHVAGAISSPIGDLERNASQIPDGVPVVAYCRGPYCVYADDAVRLLTKMGIEAKRLESGFPEWAEAGYPVETEDDL